MIRHLLCDTYILFPAIDAVKRRLLFIFLPRKEKVKDVTYKLLGTWCVMCLKECGWGPPEGMEIAAHQRVILSLVVLFYFLSRKGGSESSCFYFPIFVLLESQVRRVGYTIINSRGWAPL